MMLRFGCLALLLLSEIAPGVSFRSSGLSQQRRVQRVRSLPSGVDDESCEVLNEKWGVCYEEASAMRAAGYRVNSLDGDYDVETLAPNVIVRRAGGLGIELEEVADNGEGVGLVVVGGVVPGGNADGSPLQPGDLIVGVGPVGGPLTSVEAAPWDDFVGALGAPPPEVEELEFTVRRLVRRAKVSLTLQFPPGDDRADETLSIFAGENLRQAILTRGVKINDPLAKRFDSGGTGDCGAEGTCTTCSVAVVAGGELLTPAKTQERQMLKPRPRWRLSCKARVGAGLAPGETGELVVRVNPRQFDRAIDDESS